MQSSVFAAYTCTVTGVNMVGNIVCMLSLTIYSKRSLYDQCLTLLVGRQEGHPTCKKWWGAGVVICLERGTDLHMAQLMPLPLTVPYFSKIQIGFTFLVPAHLGSPGKRAVKWVCVCHCTTIPDELAVCY